MKRFVSIALAAMLGGLAIARTAEEKKAASKKPAHAATHKMVSEADIQWSDAPPVFPAGAKMAVLDGDPGKAGLFTVRLRVPDGYKVAAHWHPTSEHLTVISGTFNLGVGDKMDESKTQPMTAGAFGTMPAKMRHYAWAKGETEVQVHAMGPFQLIYVNPADDPSKAAKK
jgi:mannose-6-phosphate isomerase-like protein (cupin superfamily)